MTRFFSVLFFLLAVRRLHAQPDPPSNSNSSRRRSVPCSPTIASSATVRLSPRAACGSIARNSCSSRAKSRWWCPANPSKSLIVKAIRHEIDTKMPPPPRPKLSGQAIATSRPGSSSARPGLTRRPSAGQADPRKHWAFQPVKKPDLPAVKAKDWPANPIDAFILAKLEAKGLTPNRAGRSAHAVAATLFRSDRLAADV